MVIFLAWIVFILLEQKTKVNHIKNVRIKIFCNVVMPSDNTKILELHQNQKSYKAPFIIYADLEWLI